MNELGRELVPMYTPTMLSRDTRRIGPVRALTGLSGPNNLISSLSPHLMSYISHGRNRQRSCPKIHPYQVGLRSEKNYTRESANEVWRLGRQPDGWTDTQTNKHRVLIELHLAAKHTKGHELYAPSGLIQKSRKMRIVEYKDFATLLVPSHLQKQRAPVNWSMHYKGSFGNVHQIQKKKRKKSHLLHICYNSYGFWVKLTFGFVTPIRKWIL